MNRCLKTLFFLVSAALCFCVPAAVFAQSRGARSAAPAAAKVASVTFRCAFWQKPKGMPELYVKSDGGYAALPVHVMAFSPKYSYRGPLPIPVFRKATEAEIEQRKAEGVKAADAGYVPVFSINPRGMHDVGVLVLASDASGISENSVLVFNDAEGSFPLGAVRVFNFSGVSLLGRFSQGENGNAENFRLSRGGNHTFMPSSDIRTTTLQIAARVGGKPEILDSCVVLLKRNAKTVLFIVPKNMRQTPVAAGTRPEVLVRSITVYDAPPASSGKASGSEKKADLASRRSARR